MATPKQSKLTRRPVEPVDLSDKGAATGNAEPPPVTQVKKPAKPHKPVPFLSRTSGQCPAVLDKRSRNGLPMVCGAKRRVNSVWCAYHHKLYHTQNSAKGDA